MVENRKVSYTLGDKVWKGTEFGSVIRRVDGFGKVHVRWNPKLIEAKPWIFKETDLQRAVENALDDFGRHDEKLVAMFVSLIEGFLDRASNPQQENR